MSEKTNGLRSTETQKTEIPKPEKHTGVGFGPAQVSGLEDKLAAFISRLH